MNLRLIIYCLIFCVFYSLVRFLIDKYFRSKNIKTLDAILKEIKEKEFVKEQILEDIELYDKVLKRTLEMKRNYETEIQVLETKKKEIENSLETDQRIAKQSVEAIYNTAYQNMAENLDREAENYAVKFENDRVEYENQYEDMLATFTANFLKTQQELKVDLDETKKILATERSKTQAAIEANKREDEKRNENSKYRISLNTIDLQEIKHLKEVVPYLRNSRPISKIIWEAYFRAATNSMITRVVGTGPHIGIYRITNLLDGKCYIGQSVDIAERFRQHIKCGLGIDTPNNILYKAMLQDGVENFAFEVLEECERSALNTQEVYWIDYYKSQTFGYNMNKGG